MFKFIIMLVYTEEGKLYAKNIDRYKSQSTKY